MSRETVVRTSDWVRAEGAVTPRWDLDDGAWTVVAGRAGCVGARLDVEEEEGVNVNQLFLAFNELTEDIDEVLAERLCGRAGGATRVSGGAAID